MKEKPVHLVLAVFSGADNAQAALAGLPKRDPDVVSAVIVQKDAAGQMQFKDVGLTPGKGALGGVILGGVVGLLTGGTALALGALGGLLGGTAAKKKQGTPLAPGSLSQVTASLGPDTSAIIAVTRREAQAEITATLTGMGAELFEVLVPPGTSGQLDAEADEAYATLLEALAERTGGQPRPGIPYARIHVVINPASGKDKPVLNILNRVFGRYGVDWEVSITRKYGDAAEFARRAAASGFDLVVGYGGDGTQHEIANGVLGTGVPMGVLPGGTGNGFANEMGIPKGLEPAVEALCTSHNQRRIDVAQLDDGYFVQRLFTGIEPEEQTSREDKDKYGTLAYLKRDAGLLREVQDIAYRLRIDDQEIDVMGFKCYVVNSAKAGTGLSISTRFQVDDGLLDVFMLSRDLKSADAAVARFLNLSTHNAGLYYWQGKEIQIEAEAAQPVWTDGEYTGRTPVSIAVRPGALTVAVP
jgi:YegS/Rv2252/BmrU family lipid kinase